MIVLNDMPGQLCNRLWSYAPYIALSQRDDVRLFIPFFVDYAENFPNLGRLPRVHIARTGGPLYMRAMRRILRTVRGLPGWALKTLRMRVDKQNWGQERWDDATLTSRGSIVFVAAWNHRRPIDDLRPYRKRLGEVFQLRPSARIAAEAAIADLRTRAACIVGVHMRRGDYRTFLHGKYFFDWPRYARAMREFASQTGRPTAFVLCSNEPIDQDSFVGLDTIVLPNGDLYEDLHGLSLCDYIIAAPSTFSLWASFLGEVPLGLLVNDHHEVVLANFSPAMNLTQLANGTRYTLKEEAEAIGGPWLTAQ